MCLSPTQPAILNPNVWFNNVEIIAARRIGEGTVTYVANIYKYYIAYKLVEEQRAVRENARRDLQEGGSNPQ